MGSESNFYVRSEVSRNNKYYISKHRYYELKHFCLQYKDWKKSLIEGLPHEKEHYIRKCIDIVDQAAIIAGEDLSKWLLDGVIEDISYVYLREMKNIPCCKDYYYSMYRRFFYELSKLQIEFFTI